MDVYAERSRIEACRAGAVSTKGKQKADASLCAAEGTQKRAGLEFYRKYTEVMLRRYQRLSMRSGRMPSCLGQDMFRGRTSTYRIHSFEDSVIFVYDMNRCLNMLDAFERELLMRIAVQEYTQGEAAQLLGVSLRTVVRRYANALDCLTGILLDRKLMRIEY
jgi:predicted DNA-binding protein (UPF0251 family)